ncbi:hypothetical protein CEP54_008259 [Fusarium duplospermum]|uniref:Uncharacterized protein n=1 Tax=Fusarium duplospermum TaxID=1325734 RepID=A0A428PWS9_9HYPO|nr:hypothetical protein CEP54_008259 [Fusarium duplospermum]
MARGLTSDGTTYPPDSLEFPLYKNTEFRNCSSVSAKPVDCNALKNMLGDARPRNLLKTPLYTMGRPRNTFDWCTVVQCFKGYKVIPSKPYPSAHIPNNFSVWVSFNVAMLRYQCLPDEIADAPGKSNCSSAQLCSQDWMFKSYYPGFNYEDSIGPKLFLWHISEWTVLVIMITIRSGLSGKEAQAEKDKLFYWYTIIALIGVAAVYSVYCDVDIARDYFSQRHDIDHYAPVAFDEDCTAVHVALSPWKHYFDVDTGWRALWIAKAWLDA